MPPRSFGLLAASLTLFALVGAACGSSTSDAAAGAANAGEHGDAATDIDGSAPEGGAPASDAASDASGDGDAAVVDASTDLGTILLTSTAFANGGVIPDVHSVCDGANESIPLAWSSAPGGVASFAVVMRDLTLGGSGNYHWVLYDLPTSVTSLAQDIPKDASPDPPGGGAKQTRWSFGADTGFQGMCPIAGPTTHLYELSVYAIDVATLPAASDPLDPAQVDVLIQAHQIAYGRLRGSYTKQ